MNENKKKKTIAVIVAILVIAVMFCGIAYTFRNALFAIFMPKTYTLLSLEKTGEKIEEEWDAIKENLFVDEIDFDEDTTLSFWKYTNSESIDKKGDFSFDLSVSQENKRLEFAYDNTKAKKIKDMFLYIDNDEIGVNLADFSDDYWTNNAKTVISDYNNSALRDFFGKDKIKTEYDLSFKKKAPKELMDTIEKKEILKYFLKNLKFEKKEIVNLFNGEYNMYFSQSKEEMQKFSEVMLPGFENYFELKNTDIIFSLRNGEVRGASVDFSPKYSFNLEFYGKDYFLEDFSISFFINDNERKNEIILKSKGNRFDKKQYTDETQLSFTSSLGNEIYVKNKFSLKDNDIEGSLDYGINSENTTYSYNGIFDTTDGVLLDLSEVKSADTDSELGFYIENNFKSVVRKVENKKEILHLSKEELISYAKKTGGENILNLFK